MIIFSTAMKNVTTLFVISNIHFFQYNTFMWWRIFTNNRWFFNYFCINFYGESVSPGYDSGASEILRNKWNEHFHFSKDWNNRKLHATSFLLRVFLYKHSYALQFPVTSNTSSTHQLTWVKLICHALPSLSTSQN